MHQAKVVTTYEKLDYIHNIIMLPQDCYKFVATCSYNVKYIKLLATSLLKPYHNLVTIHSPQFPFMISGNTGSMGSSPDVLFSFNINSGSVIL